MKQILDCSFHRLGDVGQIMSRVANGELIDWIIWGNEELFINFLINLNK